MRRLRRSLALAIMLPALAVVGTTPAQATHGTFEIDDPANKTVDTAGNRDWETTGTRVTDPAGSADTSNFTEGSKEFQHPDDWVQGTGTVPPKDDITEVYIHSETNHEGDVLAFFGFTRVSGEGTTNYDLEFNQEPNYSNNPARPTRTPGDVLVRFEQNGNDAFTLTEAYIWTLASDADWTDACIPVPGYEPAAGWCPVATADIGFVGTTSEDGLFAEGSFNLTDLFGDGACRPAFGTMNIRSFAGESVTSSLKDYVDPVPVHFPPTCWEPIGITNVVRATFDVSYDWSVEKDVNDDRKTVQSGTNAAFTYRVLLTAGDEQRSGRDLSGTATLTNPNGSPMVATLEVTSATATGCTFPGLADADPAEAGFQVNVPDGSTNFAYTCTPSAANSGTTTATVSWDLDDFPPEPGVTTDRASADANYTFVLDQSTDEQTTVTDTFNGGAPQVLGTFSWAAVYNETDASTPPHTVVVATYTRVIKAGAAGTCKSYVNTARQTENDTGRSTTSQETVTVCAAEVLPDQAFGKAVGSVSATCQGTVRARLNNKSGARVTYKLRVGTKVHRIVVKAQSRKRFTTSGPNRARVTLKVGSRVLDRVRIPARCPVPEVLPDTGLRGI